MENSHDNICRLLNERPRNSPSGDKPAANSSSNLYLTEAEFNKNLKQRKEEEMSRSSSFEKSNKSVSVSNNSSQHQSKGFMTNLTFIKELCISVCEFIRNNQTHRYHFVTNITSRIPYDHLRYLAAYR